MQHVSTVTHALDRTAADPAAQRIARNCLMTRARQTSRVVTSVYDDALRPFGIVAQQFSLLVFIAEFGPISRSDLGRRNHHERLTLSRSLPPLIAQGWVIDDARASNGRRRPLWLAREGQALLKSAASAWSAAQSHAARLLGEAGAHQLMNIARDLPSRVM